MNWLDLVLIISMVVAAVVGVRKGIIEIAITLAGLVIGVYVAGRYYVPFSGYLTVIPHLGLAKVAAFSIIFIGVMAVAGVIARLATRMVSAVLMGWANRIGGGVLGFLLGAIFCGAFLAMWVKFMGLPSAIEQSQVAPVLLGQFPRVLALLPGEFDVVRDFFQ